MHRLIERERISLLMIRSYRMRSYNDTATLFNVTFRNEEIEILT